jgi:hypothetical protein
MRSLDMCQWFGVKLLLRNWFFSQFLNLHILGEWPICYQSSLDKQNKVSFKTDHWAPEEHIICQNNTGLVYAFSFIAVLCPELL